MCIVEMFKLSKPSMSASTEIKVPDIGDFSDVEVIEVLVAAGDTVSAEDHTA